MALVADAASLRGFLGMVLGVAVLRFSTPARQPRWHLALLLWELWL